MKRIIGTGRYELDVLPLPGTLVFKVGSVKTVGEVLGNQDGTLEVESGVGIIRLRYKTVRVRWLTGRSKRDIGRIGVLPLRQLGHFDSLHEQKVQEAELLTALRYEAQKNKETLDAREGSGPAGTARAADGAGDPKQDGGEDQV